MELRTQNFFWPGLIVAVAIGLGAGYYYGNSTGLAEGIKRGGLEEKAAEAARKKEAEKKAAAAANPFEQTSVNPFEKSPANPFEKVKVNPFE